MDARTGTRCIRRTSYLISCSARTGQKAQHRKARRVHGKTHVADLTSHSTVVPSIFKKGSPMVVCQFCGDLRIRLLSVSLILVLRP